MGRRTRRKMKIEGEKGKPTFQICRMERTIEICEGQNFPRPLNGTKQNFHVPCRISNLNIFKGLRNFFSILSKNLQN